MDTRQRRNRRVNAYVAVVAALTAVILIVALLAAIDTPPDSWQWCEMIGLIPLGIFCSRQRVYTSEQNYILMGTVAQIPAIILLPPPLAVLTVAVSKLITESWAQASSGGRLRTRLFNAANTTLAVSAGASVFAGLHGAPYLAIEHSLRTFLAFPALLVSGATYYLLDAALFAGVVTLHAGDSFRTVFIRTNRDALIPEISLILVGIVFAILLHVSPPLALFIVVPVALSVRSFAALAQLRDETEQAVLQMAKSIDLRDTGTGIHSQQLEKAARRLAEVIGLTDEHVHDIGLAARAHDLGKIEIGDAILLKRGPLSPEEREIMQEHAAIGANMLSSYSAFAKSVPFVRHHHERWDGTGYPAGLKGEEIPLGARIIAVVDAYDAMTADRPYRKALSVNEAVRRLKADMGTQFDPRICAAWIQILIEDGIYQPSAPASDRIRLLTEQAAG